MSDNKSLSQTYKYEVASNRLPKDRHVWRSWDEDRDGEDFAPDPHWPQIKCDRCGLSICVHCGTDDPSYEVVCAAPGRTFPK